MTEPSGNIYTLVVSDNEWYPGNPNYSSSGADVNDGAIIEGSVAAFFYDLTDPTDEAHDLVEYPGSYVADIIETCYVNTTDSGIIRADAVDHLITCFEHRPAQLLRAFPITPE